MLDDDKGTRWWSKSYYGGGWVEIDSPTSQFLQSIIITRTRSTYYHNLFYNVCLSVDDEAAPVVCTEDDYGNPLLSYFGNEIRFEIEPRNVTKELTSIFFTCQT